MALPNEASSSKRRPGRRRLPPLEPGPALRFVVASHPDHFRAGKTMRHVRSHVMYKHRTEHKTATNDRTNTNLQRSASSYASSTPSPVMFSSDAFVSDIDYLAPPPHVRPRSRTWAGKSPLHMSHAPLTPTMRTVIHNILSSTQEAYARSAPPVFEDASAFPFPSLYDAHSDPLDSLKEQYIESCGFLGKDKQWLYTICADKMSFLSHVSVSSVYQDLSDGLWQDSGTTVQAKTHTLSTVAGQFESNDATILSILHLLLSEVGGDECAFKVHYQGLQSLIQRKGGLCQLPNQLATYAILHLITLAILKRVPELPTSHPSGLIRPNTREPYPYVSPLYANHGNLAQLCTSCSAHTLELVNAMYELSQAFTQGMDSHNAFHPTRQHYQIYHRLLRGPSEQDSPTPDWIHESIRLAACIYTHAILHQTTFADSANSITHSAATGNTALLHALLNVVEHTNATSCWGDMRGVFLWVCLIGGAASWGMVEPGGNTPISPPIAWVRKCFSLWALKAVVSVGFEHAGGMLETLTTGLRISHLLDSG